MLLLSSLLGFIAGATTLALVQLTLGYIFISIHWTHQD